MTATTSSAVAAAREAAAAADRPVFTRPLRSSEVASFTGRRGPLADVPFVLKDNLDLVGLPTTGACPALESAPPPARSAGAVELLLEAGAVPVGKTNLDQFATGLVGSRSPYGACSSIDSPAHISGGSSSGSALAVASGIVPLALGTDTAGSGRVPAAFNGLVGLKATRGLISARGLMPACRSLDCVTTLTRTVAEARDALAVLGQYDEQDPWSRPRPPSLPSGVATHMQVVGIPTGPLDLDPLHRAAWDAALLQARDRGLVLVPFDLEPFLQAALLLYEGPWVAERFAAVGHLLEPDGPHLDPTVRSIILRGRDVTGDEVFRGLERLATLRRLSESVWHDVDALLLPVTPGHPEHTDVQADPHGVNRRLGTYTNFVNLLDLCAVALPAGRRTDGLPFGVQLVAPAFADEPLLDLASRWETGAVRAHQVEPGRSVIAVAGAHLSGLPLNPQLVALGGRLHSRTRTGPGYRMLRLPGGAVARPALVRADDGPADGLPLELWDLPHQGIGALLQAIGAPLGLGRVVLQDGTEVTGFTPTGGVDGLDVTAAGGWRQHLRDEGRTT